MITVLVALVALAAAAVWVCLSPVRGVLAAVPLVAAHPALILTVTAVAVATVVAVAGAVIWRNLTAAGWRPLTTAATVAPDRLACV